MIYQTIRRGGLMTVLLTAMSFILLFLALPTSSTAESRWQQNTSTIEPAAMSRGNSSLPFEDSGITLQNVRGGSVAWGDYDNDGDLDILLVGEGPEKVYRNDGEDIFTDINADLQRILEGSADWGDYDSDLSRRRFRLHLHRLQRAWRTNLQL